MDYQKIEYRVRPVTRFIVTRYAESSNGCGNSSKGEFDNAQAAYDVANALCKDEHQRLGWPLDDERIRYPDPGPGRYLDPNAMREILGLRPSSGCEASHVIDDSPTKL